MSRGEPFTTDHRTLAFIRRTFSLEGETVLRNGRPITTRPGARKADYRKVHIRYVGSRKITWKLSRLKLYLATGLLPAVVDHKSGDTRDDSLDNLRPATVAQNNHNRRGNRRKRHGLPRAVTKHISGRFQVQFGHGRKKIYVGLFSTVEEAVAARNAAEKPLKGAFHRPRRKGSLSPRARSLGAFNHPTRRI